MSKKSRAPIIPVILAGGTGSRLWPISREQFPKPLLSLLGGRTLLQETMVRYSDRSRFAAPLVMTGESIRFTVAEQIQATGTQPATIVLEPEARGTAPAIAAAALLIQEKDPEALILVAPSDHVIADHAGFLAALEIAAAAAEQGSLVTFSVTPSRAETGYGYIRRGAPIEANTLYRVVEFIEKPKRAAAEAMIAAGDHFWNSGMFLFKGAHFLSELERHAPAVRHAAAASLAGRKTDPDFLRLDAAAFSASPAISLDVAVMERTDRAATVPIDIGWSDVGTWAELWRIAPKDTAGNACRGDVVLRDATNCLVISEGKLTTLNGVRDLSVVVTDDAIMISGHDAAQQTTDVVNELRGAGRTELVNHVRVFRPWGYYQGIHVGDGFQAKRITVKPGGRLSLQKHAKRAEHWVVVDGTAKVTVNDATLMMKANESVFIPLGAVHRLENPGDKPVTVIEVQCGSYLGEDDIVRLEDVYGRTEAKVGTAAE